MTPEQTAVFVFAALAAAITTAATAGATGFDVPLAEYGVATVFALIGIVARHCQDASIELKAGTFSLRTILLKLAVDLPTAPMLAIVIWTLLGYGDIGYAYRAGFIIAGSYLGPEWLRPVLTGLGDFFVQRIRSKP